MSTRSAADNRQRRWAKKAERRADHVDKYTKPADPVLAETYKIVGFLKP